MGAGARGPNGDIIFRVDLTFLAIARPADIREGFIRMNKNIDAALIERAKGGNEQAVRQVLLEVQHIARMLGRDFAGDEEQARDLAQDILIEIARSLPKLREPDRLISWCFTLGKRVCMRWSQRRSRRRFLWEEFNLRVESDPSVATQPFSDPQVEMLDHERRAAIAHSLRQLGAQTQEIMSLFYIEGCSLAEIAERAQVSENAIKQRLYTGRRRLREELEQMPITPLLNALFAQPIRYRRRFIPQPRRAKTAKVAFIVMCG